MYERSLTGILNIANIPKSGNVELAIFIGWSQRSVSSKMAAYHKSKDYPSAHPPKHACSPGYDDDSGVSIATLLFFIWPWCRLITIRSTDVGDQSAWCVSILALPVVDWGVSPSAAILVAQT